MDGEFLEEVLNDRAEEFILPSSSKKFRKPKVENNEFDKEGSSEKASQAGTSSAISASLSFTIPKLEKNNLSLVEIQSTGTKSNESKTVKKNKRKFGLEYIIVSLPSSVDGVPPSMKDSPHECVLCLPKQSFNAAILAKHIHSCEHLLNVMQLDTPTLHETYIKCNDVSELHSALCEALPEPSQLVKLLVVPQDKLAESRDRILASIEAKRIGNANVSAKTFSTTNNVRSQEKRSLETGLNDGSLAKKFKYTPQIQIKEGSGDNRKLILLIGDEWARQIYEANPELAHVSTLVSIPNSRVHRFIECSMLYLNPSYRVVILVSLRSDFVYEKADESENMRLMMRNPDIEQLKQTLGSFSLKIHHVCPLTKFYLVIPAYIDFLQYHKRFRLLRPSDFARYEDFSMQIINAFMDLYETFRNYGKNIFCYNMNIPLQNPEYKFPSKRRTAATTMRYRDGMLQEGFRLSAEAVSAVAKDLGQRAMKHAEMIESRDPDSEQYNESMIRCWADCDRILIVGDHQTFKFESSAPETMMKNVTLVTEKFSPIANLMKAADKALNDETDLLIIVGFYREFAQNVLNGRYTILEPQVPVKNEVFSLLMAYQKRWELRYPRLSVIFTIPQVVDFYAYNVANNNGILENEQFSKQMAIYTHQFSVNIMSFYKELRPMLGIGNSRYWLYHITNALFDGYPDKRSTLGNFDVVPEFPPNTTFDGFKPNQPTSAKMRADFVAYINKIFNKNPVPKIKGVQ